MSDQSRAALSILGCWAHSAAGPTTSFLFTSVEATILLDTGVDPIGRLRALEKDPCDVTHVFVSHAHSDHVSGLANFVFTRQLLLRGSSRERKPLMLIAIPEVLDVAIDLIKMQYPERKFNISPFSAIAGAPLEVADGIRITSVPRCHTIPCAGLVIDSNHGRVGFTSDGSPTGTDVLAFKGVDILIGEAFGLESDVGPRIHDRGHSTAEDLSQLARATSAHRVIPFHFGGEYADEHSRDQLLQASKGSAQCQIIDPASYPTLIIDTD